MKKLYFLALLILASTFLAFGLFSEDPAVTFLKSLDPAQKEKALHSFDDQARTVWHFIPNSMFPRAGLSLDKINPTQKEYLQRLLQSFLSETGYTKATQIMSLENVLLELSKDSVMRDPGKYFIAFYGNPETDSLWSWSFEGHHLSLRFTVHDGKATLAPRFMGANPGTILSGSRKGERTLHKEEDLGLELINSLSPDQRKMAIFQEQAFRETVTGNKVKVDPLQPVGIKYEALNNEQKLVFLSLLDEYLSAMPIDQAKARLESIKEEEMGEVRFGWAGGTLSGEGHYYRIQGKSFLVEFDNTQNNANHIHTVWRDFDGDFGRDLIQEHYAHSDHHRK